MTKVFRVGFYEVVTAKKDVPFQAILQNILGVDNAKRFVDEDPESPYRIDNLQNGGEYWTGDLMMLRMNEDLTKGTKAGGREKIVMKNDEGLVEGSAMLYYPATRTVIFLENRFAGTMPRVAWFFNQFSTGNKVELRPIMRKETLERLGRIQPYYFEVQLAGVDTTRELKDRSLPAKQFFQLLNMLKAPKRYCGLKCPKSAESKLCSKHSTTSSRLLVGWCQRAAMAKMSGKSSSVVSIPTRKWLLKPSSIF